MVPAPAESMHTGDGDTPPGRTCMACGAPLPSRLRASCCPACVIRRTLHGPAEIADAMDRHSADSDAPFAHFRLHGEIGHGGMGVVHRARQPGLDRFIALKLLLLGRHSSSSSMARFREEGRNASKLDHPGIVTIHEVGEHEGQPYMAMEYLGGGNLADRLRNHPLPPRKAAALIRDIALALDHAHGRGVLHRDVKPSNILFTTEGKPKIGDFGLACCLDADLQLTRSLDAAGTPHYMAPELWSGGLSQTSVASEIYSLGAVFYECLTGRPPFMADSFSRTLRSISLGDPVSPRVLHPALPRDLETLCLKALSRDPSARFTGAAEFAAELERWLTGHPIHTRPIPAWSLLGKWMRRHPLAAATSSIAIIATLAVIITLVVANQHIARERALAVAKTGESQSRLAALHVATGTALLHEGFTEQAINQFSRALEIDAPHPERSRFHRWRIGILSANSPRLIDRFSTGTTVNAAIHPDEKSYLTGLPDGSVVLQSLSNKSTRFRIPPGDNSIQFVAFSPRGLPLLIDAIGRIRLFDIDGRAVGPWIGGEIRTTERKTWSDAFDVSADDRHIATVVPGGGLCVLDFHTGETLGPRIATSHEPLQIRFHPDGSHFGWCDADGVWMTRIGNSKPPQRLSARPTRLIAFADDGRLALCALHEPLLEIVNPATPTNSIGPIRLSDIPYDCEFIGANQQILITTRDRAEILDPTTGALVGEPMKHHSHVVGAEIDKTHSRIITAGFDGLARAWDGNSGNPVSPWLGRPGSPATVDLAGRHALIHQSGSLELWELPYFITSPPAFPHPGLRNFQISKDGRFILTLGSGFIRLQQSIPRRTVHEWKGTEAAISADASLLAIANSTAEVLLIDPRRPDSRQALATPFPPVHLALAPDGKRLAMLDAGGHGAIIDPGSPGFLTALPALDQPPHQLAFSADGRYLAATGHHGATWIVEMASGRTTFQQAAGSSERSGFVVFAADGSSAAIRHHDRHLEMIVIDPASGIALGNPFPHAGLVPPLPFADGAWLTSGRTETQLQFTGDRSSSPLLIRSRPITRVAQHPDGQLLAMTMDDGSLVISEVEQGTILFECPGIPGAIHHLHWCPDGDSLLVGTVEGVISIPTRPSDLDSPPENSVDPGR